MALNQPQKVVVGLEVAVAEIKLNLLLHKIEHLLLAQTAHVRSGIRFGEVPVVGDIPQG